MIRIFIVSIFFLSVAHAEGNYPPGAMHDWFDSLASGKGLCCSFADGKSLSDVDWDTKGGHYRVFLNGNWIDVPDEAVVKVPNKYGATVVWPYDDGDGHTLIRCFMPGSGS